MTVKPIINGFEAVSYQLRCRCNADLNLSSWLHDQHDGTASVSCLACGAVVARIAADLVDYDDTDPGPRDEKADGDWPFDDFDATDDVCPF